MADPQIAPSSRNPADNDSLAGLSRILKAAVLKDMDDCLPARVVAFDRSTNRATVQPLIQMVTTAGERVSRAHVASVPVLQLGGGGFVLNFPLKPGDIGYIKANDRDVSLFLQGMAETQPNTKRMHSFEDGVFIPAVLAAFIIAAEDAEHPVWQTLDGAARIALWSAFVKVTAPRGLLVSDVPGQGAESAILDVVSTVKAARPWPSMTQAQRDAIPNPQSGMTVWLMPEERQSTFAHGAWS